MKTPVSRPERHEIPEGMVDAWGLDDDSIKIKPHIVRPILTEARRAELEDNPTYRPWILARYPHWILYLNTKDQGLPGRVYAWLNHHVDDMGADELAPAELLEFQYDILPAIERAARYLGPVVRLNHEWLGNEVQHHRGHGHYHVTPRFFPGAFEINGMAFSDADHTARRSTPKQELSESMNIFIRDLLREHFSDFPR